jgi:hypothetical protein
VDVAAETPGFATMAGAAKRLADLLLVTLGSYRTDPSLVTWLFGRTVQARIEAGDRGARAELDRLVAKIPANGIIGLFMPAVRSPGSVASTALGEALARRKETREFRAAAAILLTTPGRLEELPFLIDVLQSSWRDDRRPTWQQVVRTLGATGDPRAVEALERARAELVGDAPFTKLLRDSVDVGLALAERPDARERVMATLSAASSDWIALLYANGLLTRWVHGDEGALPRIAAVWDADPPRMVRMQLLYGCAMAEKPPTGLPLDAWAALAAGGDDPMSRSIGLAWQFRRKVPGAAEALLALLKTTIRGEGMDDDTGAGDARGLRDARHSPHLRPLGVVGRGRTPTAARRTRATARCARGRPARPCTLRVERPAALPPCGLPSRRASSRPSGRLERLRGHLGQLLEVLALEDQTRRDSGTPRPSIASRRASRAQPSSPRWPPGRSPTRSARDRSRIAPCCGSTAG